MRKRELLGRIEELERRIAEIEAKPLPMHPPIVVYPQPSVAPYWTPYYSVPVITSGTGITSTWDEQVVSQWTAPRPSDAWSFTDSSKEVQ